MMKRFEDNLNLMTCGECQAPKQQLRTIVEEGMIREGRSIYAQSVVFICEECGYFSRELTEERKNVEDN